MTTKKLCCGESADVIVPFPIHTGTVAVSGFYGHSNIFDTAMKSRGSKQIDARNRKETLNFNRHHQQHGTVHH